MVGRIVGKKRIVEGKGEDKDESDDESSRPRSHRWIEGEWQAEKMRLLNETAHVYVVRRVVLEDDPEDLHNSRRGIPTESGEDNLAIQCISTPIPEINASKWKDLLIGLGQTFTHAVAFKKALYKYSLAHKFGYKFLKNKPGQVIVKCAIEGCPWYIEAYKFGGKDNSFLCIRTFKDQHLHFAQDNLDVAHKSVSTLTSSIIIDELRASISKSPNDIRRDIYREYGLKLSYYQAYRGKEKALAEIYGQSDESYMLIPWICQRLIESDPTTVAKWIVGPCNRFQCLFVAYGCSIKGFMEGARPILYIDGSFLSGPYKGTLLSACVYNVDNKMFPVAYAIVGGEIVEEWSWFLQNIKNIIESREIALVSNRHNSIIRAIQAIYGYDRHAFCYRQVKENFGLEFLKVTRGKRKNGVTKDAAFKLLDAIAYARLPSKFNIAMSNMMNFCLDLLQWLETHNDIDRWALTKFPHRRWDNITTNIAESFNSWVVKERKYNIVVFMYKHREKLAKKLHNSKVALEKWTNSVGVNVETKLKENVLRGDTLQADFYALNSVRVKTLNVDVRVNLELRECSCMAWQMSGLPCPRVCSAIKLSHGNIYQYVEEWYHLSCQEKIYGSNMIPIKTFDIPKPDTTTLINNLSQTFLQPPLTSHPPGRLRTRRIESQFQYKKIYHCSRCGEAGHSRKTCKNPNPS
ncbi:uncharacterized protein LOC129314046 [Prosopis cineraria]|uniref:uncharacterized protein LOC129314046 n=1 Tax=Prosopis cineraria TaxID=364024 RepID=UPI00240FFD8F|nr:uncharacterized protein LOC129314046 [Prosopis cineraria]